MLDVIWSLSLNFLLELHICFDGNFLYSAIHYGLSFIHYGVFVDLVC